MTSETPKSKICVCQRDLKCPYFNRALTYVPSDMWRTIRAMTPTTTTQSVVESRFVSSVMGNGLFATEEIPKGYMWDDDGKTDLQVNDLDMNSEAVRSLDPTDVKRALSRYQIVSQLLMDTKTMAKASRHNVQLMVTVERGAKIISMVALHTIHKGTQLSRHYGLAYWYTWFLSEWGGRLDRFDIQLPSFEMKDPKNETQDFPTSLKAAISLSSSSSSSSLSSSVSSSSLQSNRDTEKKEEEAKTIDDDDDDDEDNLRIIAMYERILECVESWSNVTRHHRLEDIERNGRPSTRLLPAVSNYKKQLAAIQKDMDIKTRSATAARLLLSSSSSSSL